MEIRLLRTAILKRSSGEPTTTRLRRTGCAAIFLVLAWLAASSAARAQQPFITDDADVTARGDIHIEFANFHDLLRRAARPAVRQNTASLEVAYGLLEGVEVSVEASFITIINERGATPRRVSGLADANLAVKYNFLTERENSRLPAFAISGNIELPTGNARRGTGSGAADYGLNLILQKSLTNCTVLRSNLGVVSSGSRIADGARVRGTVLTGGASVVRRFRERLYLGAEFAFARTSTLDLGADQVQFQVGGNYFLRERFSLDFGVYAGARTSDPRAGVQLGFAYDF